MDFVKSVSTCGNRIVKMTVNFSVRGNFSKEMYYCGLNYLSVKEL